MRLVHLHRQRAVFCLVAVMTVTTFGATDDSARLVFPLEEMPNFDNWDMGHNCDCRREPTPNVVYPAFSSVRPLHGEIRVDMELDDPDSGTLYHFALDESGGTGTGYNRLYIDLNGDGRLSDETPVTPLRELPPGHLFTQKWSAPPVWFGYVTFSSRDGTETHSVQTLPRFTEGGFPRLNFQATTARRGWIEIDGRRIAARIWNSYPIGTRWDRPATTVRLETPNGSVALPYWLGCNRLRALPRAGDKLWRISTIPAGSRLIVEPYAGGWGTIEIRTAGQPPRNASFYGSLLARDKAVAVGEPSQPAAYKGVQRWEVPVGDYAPGVLSIRCGPLLFSLYGNDLSGVPSSTARMSSTYPWRIRENETLTLEFADKPRIVFASPADGARLRAGDELKIAPFLVDPKLNATVRGLRRQHEHGPSSAPVVMSAILSALLLVLLLIVLLVVRGLVGHGRPEHRHVAYLGAAGLLTLGLVFTWNALWPVAQARRWAYNDLGPRATISRANGEIVAGGPMPFG
jgi:hypothetical protein